MTPDDDDWSPGTAASDAFRVGDVGAAPEVPVVGAVESDPLAFEGTGDKRSRRPA